MRQRISFIGCIMLLFIISSALAAEGPTDQVRTMLNEVMAIQNDPALQGPERREDRRTGIKKIIANNFDFNIMARNALGDYWAKLNDSGKKEFVGIFQDLFQDSYTKLVLDFLKREQILFNQESIEKNTAEVGTAIVRKNEKIPVDYYLTQENERWLVHDVAIDSVSIAKNYQRSFSRIIQRESFQSLLSKMRLQQKAIEHTGRDQSVPSGRPSPDLGGQ